MHYLSKLAGYVLIMMAVFIAVMPVHAQEDSSAFFEERIKSFHADIVVNTDSTVDVTETIVYDFGNEQRRGIYRNIPLAKVPGGVGPILFSWGLITDETGKAYAIDTQEVSSQEAYIRIGSPSVTISGKHTYVISYTVQRALGYFDTFDEIYWNVTGNEWQVPIDVVTAKVYLPTIISQESIQAQSYCGFFGESESCSGFSLAEQDGQTFVSFASDGGFGPYKGMTIAVGFPKGLVAQPELSFWEKGSTYLYASIGIALTCILFFLWWFFLAYIPLRRKHILPIVTEYTPPEGMSPSVAGATYMTYMSTGKMVTADVLYLASSGYISITATEDTERATVIYTFLKKKMLVATVLLGALGGIYLLFGWVGLAVLALIAFVYYKKIRTGIRSIMAPVHFSISRTEKPFTEAGHMRDLYNLVTSPEGSVDLSDLRAQGQYAAFDAYRMDVLRVATVSKNARSNGFIAMVFVVPIVLFVAWLIISEAVRGELPIEILCIPAAVIFGVALLWGVKSALRRAVTRRTPLWYAVAGLREYIRIAEIDRIRFHSDTDKLPHDATHVFSTLLPYAVAFGLEEKWVKAFDGIVGQPDWYQGSPASVGSLTVSLRTLNGAFSGISNAGRPTSSGSSGSSGGGSSGGGGGGGGGGSW